MNLQTFLRKYRAILKLNKIERRAELPTNKLHHFISQAENRYMYGSEKSDVIKYMWGVFTDLQAMLLLEDSSGNYRPKQKVVKKAVKKSVRKR